MAAAVALVFGPWTDSPSELAGWDVERFQTIADQPGLDLEVEYPPGSVLLIEGISASAPPEGGGVTKTHKTLVVLSLAVDLGVAVFLERLARPRSGLLYLWLGLPLVPAGLLRFDLWATGLGAVGLVMLAQSHRPRGRSAILFGLATALGFAVKLTPGLLLPVAVAAGRRTEAIAAVVGLGGVGLAWLAFGGFESIEAVTSLRGATGWHLESVPGAITSLATDRVPRLEANAFRIGTIQPWLVTTGRIATLAAIVGYGLRLHMGESNLRRMSLMLLGSTAALIVTAPLISPQFLLWLTPAAALAQPQLWGECSRFGRLLDPTWITGAAIALTAAVLVVFTPSGVDHPVAAALLLVRSGLLVLLIVACWLQLATESIRPNESLAGG